MKIILSKKFLRQAGKLSGDILALIQKQKDFFIINPFDPKLKTHKLHGKLAEYWSFSINHTHRIIFEFVDSNTVWFHSVGSHDIYE